MLQGTLAVEETGGGAEFTYTVENAGDDPAEVTFMSGQSFDITVTDDGEEVWRWSQGRMFTQAIREETIAPGDTRTFSGEWTDPNPGTYEATATLAAQSQTAEATAEFSI